MRFIGLVLCGLICCSCKQVIVVEDPIVFSPEITARKIVVSYLSLPVEIDLKNHIDSIDTFFPKSMYGEEKHCEGLSYEYEFHKKSLDVVLESSSFLLNVHGGLGLSVEYCPKCVSLWGYESCVVPRVYGSCGKNNEKKRTLSLSYKTDLDFTSDYKINSKTKLLSLRLLDPCEFSFLKIDATEQVEKSIKTALIKEEAFIDGVLSKIDLKTMISDYWVDMQKSISLGSYGFLFLNPKHLFLNGFQLSKNTLTLQAGISLAPQLIPDNTEIKSSPLPLLKKRTPQNETIGLYTDVNLSYSQIKTLLNEQIKGKNINIKNRFFEVDSIQICPLDKNQIQLAVFFGGTKKGSIHFNATPVFSDDFSFFYMKDLSFTLKTKSVLLKSARWLYSREILTLINQHAGFSVKEIMEENVRAFNRSFSSFSLGSLRSNTTIDSMIPTDFYIDKSGLFVRFLIRGKMKLSL